MITWDKLQGTRYKAQGSHKVQETSYKEEKKSKIRISWIIWLVVWLVG